MEEKKVYDTTVAFTFFGDWVEAIEDYETEADRNSTAYMLFKSISGYSMYDSEPDFDNNETCRPFKAFWPMIAKAIISSRKQRQRGRGFVVNNGPDATEQRIINEYLSNPGIKQLEVARRLGIDKNKVNRTIRKYEKLLLSPTPSPTPNNIPTPTSTAWEKVSKSGKEIDDDSLPF